MVNVFVVKDLILIIGLIAVLINKLFNNVNNLIIMDVNSVNKNFI